MRIGLIGLGNMGAGMARNIRAAGFDLTVYDVREEAMAALERVGASRGPSPAAVARAVDVVLTSLPGPDQVASVTVGAEGVLEGIGRDAVLVETSTSRPTLIREVARRFAAKGAHVLDAPVSGGKEGAENRNLAVMVGGRREVFDRVRPVLDAIGDKVTWVGAIGCGTVAKLVHNMVSACSRMAIAEGMTLGVKAGVAPEVLLDALSKSSFGQMRVLKDMIPNTVFPGAYDDVNFALRLLRKDVGLATELGREYHVPMMIAAIAEQQLEEALRRGWGDKDSMTFFKLQEERAGVELRTKKQGA